MQLPTLAGIEDAARLIEGHVRETPLIRSEALSGAFEAEIWLKNETTSPIGSYKLRGALTAILRERSRQPVSGAVTSSSGNHGQGVAYAARLLGLSADVFLPEGANPLKAQAIRTLGTTIHAGGPDIDAAKEAGRAFAAQHGRFFVDDGENLDMMEGAGTVGLEVGRALPDLAVMFVPMGSGVIAGSSAAALKALQPAARVVAINGEGSTAMAESFRAGHAVERPITAAVDSMNYRVPAARTLAGVIRSVDDVAVVSERELFAAVHAMAECAHILVEPAGAAALAAAWQQRDAIREECICLVLTGANITMAHLRTALDTPPPFKP